MRQNKPKVSIIIPAYNREPYVGIAIKSVLDQTYRDLELIIVDDGSTDGTLAIAEQFSAEDDRVRVLTEKTNRGAAYALKIGFEAARGEYMGQLDSDDLFNGNTLEETINVLDQNPNCGLVHTHYQDIDEDGHIMHPGWRCSYPYSLDLILKVFMLFHFRLFRKSLYEFVGGIDLAFNLVEDYDLCLRMSENTEVLNIPKFLYLYRNHTGSVHTNNRLTVIQLTLDAIQAALIRRGMAETHWIDVRYNPEINIREKNHIQYPLL